MAVKHFDTCFTSLSLSFREINHFGQNEKPLSTTPVFLFEKVFLSSKVLKYNFQKSKIMPLYKCKPVKYLINYHLVRKPV